MKYFENVTTIEELRKKYRELLKKHHPDNGGDVSIMQEINSQYDALFDVLSHSESADGKTYTKEDDEQFRAMLDAISGFNITVQIIGDWVWHSEPYRRHHKGEVSID